MNNPKLSVVILNHNTKEILFDCLKSLEAVKNEIDFEVIVSDNGSTDGSVRMVENEFGWVKLVSGPNISYSNGNNRVKNVVKGEYVLFLNSDTLVHKRTLRETVKYLENHKSAGALTCKLILPDGNLDKDARRRFPTPWISFKRLFLGMGGDYWYEDVSPDKTHPVDAIEGAFFLVRKQILDKAGWFDEKFVFDGEDLDLSYRIRKLGYEIIYYPEVSITHIKKASKKESSGSERIMQGVDSMEYFYRKNLWDRYPLPFNYFVILGIKILRIIRSVKL